MEVEVTRSSKRGTFMRIVNDLQRFNEEQLKILIDLAHRVRRARRLLRQVALEADEMLTNLPEGGRPGGGVPNSRYLSRAAKAIDHDTHEAAPDKEPPRDDG